MIGALRKLKQAIPLKLRKTKFAHDLAIKGGKFANLYFQCKFGAGNWKRNVHNLMKEEKFNLIILDTARYDYFAGEYEDYVEGTLRRAVTPTSATIGTLSETFNGLHDLTYFSAMPIINSKRVPFPAHNYFNFDPWEHFKEIVDIWDFGWDKELGTTPPNAVNKAVLKRIERTDRRIIHYAQPHGSWIADPQVFVKEESTVTERVERGDITSERMKRAYKNNLRLALEHTAELVKDLDGRTVITADHGELLGEHGKYGQHPLYLPVPELRVVPWLEVK